MSKPTEFIKTYRFRLYPTKEQESFMKRQAGARRFVWNWGLQRFIECRENRKMRISYRELSAELTKLKRLPETSWLSSFSAASLHQALLDLDKSIAGFYSGTLKHPKFKSKKQEVVTFRIPQKVRTSGRKIFVSKLGWVKTRQDTSNCKLKDSATFKMEPCGNWYATMLSSEAEYRTGESERSIDGAVGIDLGLKSLVATSDGELTENPRFYAKLQRKIIRLQRIMSRRQKSSKRREKARVALAKSHQRASNQRKDFIHKITSSIINRYSVICIESLNFAELARHKLLYKSFGDASLAEIRRQLEYKSAWNSRTVVAIDRFFPSSKKCCCCGAINNRLSLSDREWDCLCGAHHDRDVNAAINIRDEGLRMLAVGHTESLNAREREIIPG